MTIHIPNGRRVALAGDDNDDGSVVRATLAESTSEQCCPPLLAEPLSAVEAVDTAKIFKALGDPVRLRLLSLIASRGDAEVCVCELTGEFEVTAPTISFHLRVLREIGLVSSERRATWVYYRVNRAMLERLSGFFAAPALTTR